MNLPELTELLENSITQINNISPLYAEAVEFLYKTGMRQIELFELTERKTVLTERHISYRTAKTNAIRTLPKDLLPALWIARIEAGKPVIQQFTYLMLNRALRQSGLNNVLINGKKRETTHLYRHRLAKQIHQDTNSIFEVMNYFNITEAVARGYVYSVIE